MSSDSEQIVELQNVDDNENEHSKLLATLEDLQTQLEHEKAHSSHIFRGIYTNIYQHLSQLTYNKKLFELDNSRLKKHSRYLGENA